MKITVDRSTHYPKSLAGRPAIVGPLWAGEGDLPASTGLGGGRRWRMSEPGTAAWRDASAPRDGDARSRSGGSGSGLDAPRAVLRPGGRGGGRPGGQSAP